MAMSVAKMGDQVVAVDTHIVLVPTPGPTPTPLPHPFSGVLDGGLVQTVKVNGQPVAVQGSTATNTPPHLPTPPGVSFQKPPANRGAIQVASATVKAGGQPLARNGDVVQTCNDPVDVPAGQVIAVGTVTAG
jgi:uncharacterized Zn-binding protein involved in type VI secretion